jgi:hypothetical protein
VRGLPVPEGAGARDLVAECRIHPVRWDEIKPGGLYGLRGPTSESDGTPTLVKVRASATRRGQKIKVGYVEGEFAGLDEWVATRNVLCSWAERRAFLRDERARRVLAAASAESHDKALEDAVGAVMGGTGDGSCYYRSSWDLSLAEAERLWARAKLAGRPEDEPNAYIDRRGELHMSFGTAVKFAQAFAAAEPEPCLLYMREREAELRSRGFIPGETYAHGILRETLVGHAIARDWASRRVSESLEAELGKLRTLVSGAAATLEKQGDEREAARLRRALRGL